MKVFRNLLYLLSVVLLIIGLFKIIALSQKEIVTVHHDGVDYNYDKNIEGFQLYKSGDGEDERNEQHTEILKTGLTFGGGILVLLLFSTLLKNKVEDEINLKSDNISGSYSYKTYSEQNNNSLPSENELFKNMSTEIGLQYQKLAESANGCYMLLQDIKSEIGKGNEKPEHLFYACYIVRSEIIDRIEKFKLNVNTPIVVPMIPGENKTLEMVINILKQNISTCSQKISYYDECNEILHKDDFYYEFESGIHPNSRINF